LQASRRSETGRSSADDDCIRVIQEPSPAGWCAILASLVFRQTVALSEAGLTPIIGEKMVAQGQAAKAS
jgi:hypothetical protein